MSVRHEEKLSCPQCGSKIEMMIWDSINADLDPDARDALLQGKIHVADCPACKQAVKVIHPILYHDMERDFFVMYRPFEGIEDPGFFDSFSLDGHLDLDAGLPEDQMPKYAKNVHYVLTMEELSKYVIFREKLASIKNAQG